MLALPLDYRKSALEPNEEERWFDSCGPLWLSKTFSFRLRFKMNWWSCKHQGGIRNPGKSKGVRDRVGKGQEKEKKQVQEKRGKQKAGSKKERTSLYFFHTCLSLPWITLRQKGHLSCAESSTVLSVVVQKLLNGINKKTAVYVVMSSGEWVSVTVLQYEGIDVNHLFLWSFPRQLLKPHLWEFFFPSIPRFYYSQNRETRSLEKLCGLPKATQRQMASSGHSYFLTLRAETVRRGNWTS